MFRSKLLDIISVFDQETLADCQLFLKSPYLQSKSPNDYHQKLFDWILEATPNLENERLSKKATFAAIFPDKPYQTGRLEKVMSALLKELYRFISYQEIKKAENGISFQLNQALFFRNQNLEKYYQKIVQQIQEKQKNRKAFDIDFYFHHYLIQKELSFHAALNNSRTEALNIPATIDSLDTFYLVKKLEYSCWLLAQNQNRTIEDQASIQDFEKLLFSQINEKTLENEPLIKAYALAFKLLKSNEEKNYIELQKHLEDFELEIPFVKLKALQTLCRNYCIARYNSNETQELLQEAFNLYKRHLEKGFLYYQGGLLPSTIKNLVVKGLTLDEHQWVYKFLEDNKDKIIGTSHPMDVYHFNMAWYYFSRKKYDEALALLSDSYEDVYYKVAAKRLEIMIRYEEDSLLTETRLDAFKIYIFRLGKKSISKLQKEGNNNFADLMKQVINPKTAVNNTRIQKLIQKTKDTKVLADKAWLIQRLNMLLDQKVLN